jgi:glutamate-ammonia-ligase adenylyltransferase
MQDRMAALRPHDLLLAPQLSDAQVDALLKPYGFSDCRRADANLQALADDPVSRTHLAEVLDLLLNNLAASADPDQALDYLERFAKAGPGKLALLTHLRTSPATIQLLTTVFGSSPFLSQILIRNPEYLHWVSSPAVLERVPTRRELETALAGSVRTLRAPELKLDALRRFKRRELLAIGVRDLLRKATVEQTTKALSHLATVVIQQAYVVCRTALASRYGKARSGFTVLALGKLGGGELNFSSDVDLMYLCGKATKLSHEAYFRKLAQDLTQAMTTVTNEGYLFRVDLRLRPEGKSGRIVDSLESYRQYYRGSRGAVWERLALIKAWPIAGDTPLGTRFLEMVRPFVYQPASLQVVLADVRKIKQQIDKAMAKRGEGTRNVKLGTGGIREVEFLTQTMQAAFGHTLPGIRERNTATALAKLLRARLLAEGEHRALVEAYWFLRDVEHKLQMVEERQTHTLPADPLELRKCALRMGYRDSDEVAAQDLFLRDHARHTERIHEVFARVLAGTTA